jgi:hypothetical protein
MRNRRFDISDITPDTNLSQQMPADDDALSAPMNRDRVRERVALAQAYFARNPVHLVTEIIGF